MIDKVSSTETGEVMLLQVVRLPVDVPEETLSGLGWFALFHARYAGSGISYPSSNCCSNSLTCSRENDWASEVGAFSALDGAIRLSLTRPGLNGYIPAFLKPAKIFSDCSANY